MPSGTGIFVLHPMLALLGVALVRNSGMSNIILSQTYPSSCGIISYGSVNDAVKLFGLSKSLRLRNWDKFDKSGINLLSFLQSTFLKGSVQPI